jgi:hypothetical protein
MIETGKKCTVFPDNEIQYEITNVMSKTVSIKVDEKKETVTNYFVDLKQVDNTKIKLQSVSINNITLLNE